MLKSLTLLSVLAAFAGASAQFPVPSDAQSPTPTQPSAPIVRDYRQHRPWQQPDRIVDSQPIPGVWLRSESTSAVKTVSAAPQRTEIRLDRGRLNVTIHHAAQHTEILIDLPSGQTSPLPVSQLQVPSLQVSMLQVSMLQVSMLQVSMLQVSLLKDGLYTFNADTGTVRVLRGEAAYVGPVTANANAKPIKIKEDHQISLAAPASAIKSVGAYPYELAADLLPRDNHGEPDYPRYADDYPPYGPYPDFADAWGYPYYPGFYEYPFAYGIGFGNYGGGFYRGGFRR